VSTILKENLIGLDSNRTIKVYLPPGYQDSKRSYPVVYYCHSIFSTAEKLLEDGKLVNILEQAFSNNVIQEFIFVAADYSSPTAGYMLLDECRDHALKLRFLAANNIL
jgi:enterochelin esterase-like enzyme